MTQKLIQAIIEIKKHTIHSAEFTEGSTDSSHSFKIGEFNFSGTEDAIADAINEKLDNWKETKGDRYAER